MLEPGAMVTASVKLKRELGHGGMGTVWVAEHVGLRTDVVVKFMAVELAKDQVALSRFSREAASASQVRSPHVVQMFDHGVTDDGVPFIIMELLDGMSLGERLELGPVSIAETVVIIDQVCRALSKAHEAGIWHRDIKPDNIFLCESAPGEVFVKVLDFGIAKSAELKTLNATSTGAMVGTPFYMSPEQAIGTKDIDHRTDLWSVAVVAYECLTGKLPFDGDTIGALTLAIHTGPIPEITAANPALSPAMNHWFFKACARDPNQRFESARALSHGLADASGAVNTRSSAHSYPGKVPALAAIAQPTLSTTAGGAVSQPIAHEEVRLPVSRTPGYLLVAALVLLVGGGGLALALRAGDPSQSTAAGAEVGEKVDPSTIAKDTMPPPEPRVVPVAAPEESSAPSARPGPSAAATPPATPRQVTKPRPAAKPTKARKPTPAAAIKKPSAAKVTLPAGNPDDIE
jgi:serine/threonine-protein kinase